MKVAQQFEFKVVDGYKPERVYTATQIDGTQFQVTWVADNELTKAHYPIKSVISFIESGAWRVLRVTLDGEGNVLPDLPARVEHEKLADFSHLIDMGPVEGSFEAEQPHVFGDVKYINGLPDEFRVQHGESGNEYMLRRDAGGDYSIYNSEGKVNRRVYTAPEMLNWIEEGRWKLIPTTFREEASEPEFMPPDDFLTLVGAELEAIRRFCEENEGWYVEVDADFYAVKNYDFEGEAFTVANEAQLAEVMEAIRTLNKYTDNG